MTKTFSPIPVFLLLICVAAAVVFALPSLMSFSSVMLANITENTLRDDLPELVGIVSAEASSTLLLAKASQDYSESHGLERHGTGALAVRDCISQRGAARGFVDPNGLRLFICQIPDGRIGIQVEKNVNGVWKSVTEYIKNEYRDVRDVANWLFRCGDKPL